MFVINIKTNIYIIAVVQNILFTFFVFGIKKSIK